MQRFVITTLFLTALSTSGTPRERTSKQLFYTYTVPGTTTLQRQQSQSSISNNYLNSQSNLWSLWSGTGIGRDFVGQQQPTFSYVPLNTDNLQRLQWTSQFSPVQSLYTPVHYPVLSTNWWQPLQQQQQQIAQHPVQHPQIQGQGKPQAQAQVQVQQALKQEKGAWASDHDTEIVDNPEIESESGSNQAAFNNALSDDPLPVPLTGDVTTNEKRKQGKSDEDPIFTRGHIESRPLEDEKAFARGHIESKPSESKKLDGSGTETGRQGFNRAAVENSETRDNNEHALRAVTYDASAPKVVCYFASWASYRKGKGSFLPEHVDPNLCTHVIYAFANLDKSKMAIKESDPWLDIKNNFYGRIVDLKKKNPALKVLLAVGGWSDSGDDKYSVLAHSPQARTKFARESRDYLKLRGFDGMSLDWHYPKCWQSNCEAGLDSDKTAFSLLIREIKAAFEPDGLLVSATLSGYKEVVDLAYEVPALSQNLDLMNIMAYDYHGSWESRTGHLAPLYMGPPSNDPSLYYNANFTMDYYVTLGADRSKLVLGVPMYGQSFQLVHDGDSRVGSDAKGPGNPGEFTQQPGMLAYYEICKRVKDQRWEVVKDLTGSWGPYAHLRDQWVGYDDADSLARKSRFVKSQRYGGVFVWTLDLDDFRNECCGGPSPLLRTVAREILNVDPKYDATRMDCTPPPEPVTPTQGPDATTTVQPSLQTTKTTKRPLQTTTTTWWEPSEVTSGGQTTATVTTNKPTSSSSTYPVTEMPVSSTTVSPNPSLSSSSSTEIPVTSTTFVTSTSTSEIPPTSLSPPPSSQSTPKPHEMTTIIFLCQHYQPSTTTATTMTTTSSPSTAQSSSTYKTTTTQRPTTTTSIAVSTPSPSTQSCDGAWTYKPVPSDCSSYYQCVSGRAVLLRCPVGLHWNQYSQGCDWPASAKCQSYKPNSTTQQPTTQMTWWTTTTSAPVAVWSTTASPPFTECVTGEYYPAPNCDQYYLCSNGLKRLQSCGPGLHWDQRRKLCDWPNAAMCQSSTGMISAWERPKSPCQDGSYSGSNEDCEVYFMCVHGNFMRFRCQPGLHWNQEAKACDWPANAGCTLVGPAPTEGSTSTTTEHHTTQRPTTTHWTTEMSTTTKQPNPEPTTVGVAPKPTEGPIVPVQGGKKDYMIVCYFTNWAWYRPGIGKYTPDDINPNLCTHIVYGFAVLDYSDLVIKPHDTWADYDNKFYEKVTAYKSKGTKVTLAIGGWNDSQGDKYSRLVNNPSARRKFISNVIDFLKKNNFDGLDLDWEYPKCWQVECNKGPDSDKPNFAAFVRELKEAFQPHGLLLSAAVSPSKMVIDAGYDVKTISRYLDWIAVMTYDFHGQWDKKTGHVAPLYFHEEDDTFYFNANYSLNYWINQGADRKKIVMGMPLYGQSFTLSNPSNHDLNAPSSGGGTAGEYTRASGFLAYYEICKHVQKDGWTVVQDMSGAIGPYAYKGNQWVSYDDVAMIRKKSQLIRDMGLAGGMVWALDLDDFRNTCGQGQYPLLSTIKSVLGRPRDQEEESSSSLPDEKKQQKPMTTHRPVSTVTVTTVATTKKQVVSHRPVPSLVTRKPDMANACADEPFRPHAKDCRRYYICLFGRYVEQKCPGGTFWNKDHCDWTCGSEPTQSPNPPPQPVQTTPSPQPQPTEGPSPSTTTIPETTTSATTTTTTTTLAPWTPAPTMSTTTAPWWTPSSTVATSPWWTPSSSTQGQVWSTMSTAPTTSSTSWEWKPPIVTTTTIDPIDVGDTEYKVVCYFTNWAWYRQGIGKYKPEDIDYNLCTHIAYGFAVLDSGTLQIKPHDSWADIDNQFYKQVTDLKAKGKKVVIAIGGWNDSLGDKYSRLVRDAAARRRFIAHVMDFIEKWGFDGLDLDWEYPKCWQTECKKGPDSDKPNFATFVRELSDAFKPKGYLLSAAVSPSKVIIDEGYDVPTVSHYLDWIAVMTYDYHGQWDKKTGHVAPLYHHEESDNFFFNSNYSINYWISQGADRRKIVMGMPMYGQSFALQDANNHGLNSKSYGGGEAGEYTRAQGFLSYYEICKNIRERGWTVVQDSSGAMGPYAYKGNQWVSYDDANMIRRKSQYIRDMGLGGGMIWALDLDDFRGVCGCEKHPLLKTINRVLRRYPDPDPNCTLP